MDVVNTTSAWDKGTAESVKRNRGSCKTFGSFMVLENGTRNQFLVRKLELHPSALGSNANNAYARPTVILE